MKFAGAILFLILYSPFFAGGAQLSEAEVKLASNHQMYFYLLQHIGSYLKLPIILYILELQRQAALFLAA